MAALASRVAKLERARGPQERLYRRIITMFGDTCAAEETIAFLASQGIEQQEDDLVIQFVSLSRDPNAEHNPELKDYPPMPLVLDSVIDLPAR